MLTVSSIGNNLIHTAESPFNCSFTDWQCVMNYQYSLNVIEKLWRHDATIFTHLFSPFKQWWNIFFSSAPARTNSKNCLRVYEFPVCHFCTNFYSFFKNGTLLHTVLDLSFISLHLMTRIYLNKTFDC